MLSSAFADPVGRPARRTCHMRMPGDHEALAGAIRALIGDAKERRRRCAAGRRRIAEAFSVERMVAAFERIYR